MRVTEGQTDNEPILIRFCFYKSFSPWSSIYMYLCMYVKVVQSGNTPQCRHITDAIQEQRIIPNCLIGRPL